MYASHFAVSPAFKTFSAQVQGLSIAAKQFVCTPHTAGVAVVSQL
jgi:hypothetical protein